jgi:hypothetical protein
MPCPRAALATHGHYPNLGRARSEWWSIPVLQQIPTSTGQIPASLTVEARPHVRSDEIWPLYRPVNFTLVFLWNSIYKNRGCSFTCPFNKIKVQTFLGIWSVPFFEQNCKSRLIYGFGHLYWIS